jgi:hypothetical protein
MALINTPPNSAVDGMNMDGNLTPPVKEWRNFFVAVFNICNALTLSGTTAQRPTSFLFVGRTYFDTTLGIPIWIQSLGPTVWIDAAGAPV